MDSLTHSKRLFGRRAAAARTLRLLLTLAIVAVLAACTPANPHLRGAIVDIDLDILGRYWVVSQTESVISVSAAPRDDCGDGFVIVRYVIDSHGHVFESRVLRAEPEGCYEDAALLLLQQWQFVPTRFNRGRIPVRITQRIPFSSH